MELSFTEAWQFSQNSPNLPSNEHSVPNDTNLPGNNNLQDGYVFISYSKEDRDYAHNVVKKLKKAGLCVWIDYKNIQIADDWDHVIYAAIEACSAFVIIMTPTAYNSPMVKSEREHARRHEKPIFPILLEGDVFPIYAPIQYFKAEGGKLPDKAFIERLKEAVTSYTKAPVQPPKPTQPTVPPKPRRSKRQIILVAILSFLLGLFTRKVAVAAPHSETAGITKTRFLIKAVVANRKLDFRRIGTLTGAFCITLLAGILLANGGGNKHDVISETTTPANIMSPIPTLTATEIPISQQQTNAACTATRAYFQTQQANMYTQTAMSKPFSPTATPRTPTPTMTQTQDIMPLDMTEVQQTLDAPRTATRAYFQTQQANMYTQTAAASNP